ncbi:unnamed protein product [Diabrotica balteata]|uniref:BAG domain-containing protein n=1 Tax=Diabrotica balteata TaxID=107213 RepID=A0A9N9T0L5_DIABA|nr:unnamed protein product [Diabrotica balteata]
MSFPRSHFTDNFDADSARDNFPFNRNANRDDYFKSTLDNLAKRHPELAEHFQDINQRPRSRSRPAEELKSRFRRPFGDKFPFDDEDDFDIDPSQYTQHFYPQEFHQSDGRYPQTSFYQETPRGKSSSAYPQADQAEATSTQHSYPQEFHQSDGRYPQTSFYQETPREGESSSAYPQADQAEATPTHPQPSPHTETTVHPPQKPCPQEKERPGIQQSNTVDLGQRQEPIDDRNQRSMSAPPVGESKKRYTSSINIPVNVPSENMSQSQQPEQKSNERIIPIQVEGVDGPVFPKNPNIPPPQSHPMPDRFGHRPEPFPRAFQDEHFTRQNIPHNFQQYHPQHPSQPQYYQHPKDDIPIPVQRDNFERKQQPQQQQHQQHQHQQQQHPQQPHQQQQHQQQPQQHYQPSPPSQQQQPTPQATEEQEAKPASQDRRPTPIEQIQEIQKDVSSLMEQVEKFAGKSRDKQYLYLDEMLTRNLIKLDNIDTQGQDTIRLARKEAIKCIQQAIALLESKASTEEKMDVDQKVADGETKDTNMDKSDEKSELSNEQKNVEDPKNMEVTENSQKKGTQPDQLPVNPNSESEINASAKQETVATVSKESTVDEVASVDNKESKDAAESDKEKKGKKT